jgi:hypothetical protein
MKKLHKIGNVLVLQITRAAECAHREVRILNDSGDRVCLHCGKSIHHPLYAAIVNRDIFNAA